MVMAGVRIGKAAVFSHREYESLAEFRYQLELFLRRRRDAARAEGLQAQQYELLLAISGLPSSKQPTIKEISAQLQLQHHTVVELADRLQKQKLLTRQRSPEDKRVVLLQVTATGRAALDRIVRYSLSHLRNEAPALIQSLRRILDKRS